MYNAKRNQIGIARWLDGSEIIASAYLRNESDIDSFYGYYAAMGYDNVFTFSVVRF